MVTWKSKATMHLLNCFPNWNLTAPSKSRLQCSNKCIQDRRSIPSGYRNTREILKKNEVKKHKKWPKWDIMAMLEFWKDGPHARIILDHNIQFIAKSNSAQLFICIHCMSVRHCSATFAFCTASHSCCFKFTFSIVTFSLACKYSTNNITGIAYTLHSYNIHLFAYGAGIRWQWGIAPTRLIVISVSTNKVLQYKQTDKQRPF